MVSITPVSALPLAKSEEPMDAAPSEPALPEVKKGLSKVKLSSAIAKQSIEAVSIKSKCRLPPPLHSPLLNWRLSLLQGSRHLFKLWNKRKTGLMLQPPPSLPLQKTEDSTDVGEQAAPPNLPFRELVQKVTEFWSIPDPAAEEDYKLGSALGRDPLLLQQEKLDRAPSIKIPMVADLSLVQTAQDESVKPRTSNTLEIGKFPGILPHKGSWYSVVDNKFSQIPQVVPQTFSNIAKPGYSRVASRMRFPRDRALIRLQTRIFLEAAVTKLYENA